MKTTRLNARKSLLLVAPLLPALLSGCLRARVDESRELATAIAKTQRHRRGPAPAGLKGQP